MALTHLEVPLLNVILKPQIRLKTSSFAPIALFFLS